MDLMLFIPYPSVDPDAVAPTDQMGYIYGREHWEQLKHSVDLFYYYATDQRIVDFNAPLHERYRTHSTDETP